MKDIDRLKRLNALEKIGLLAKNSPGKLIALGIAFVLILTLAALSPQLVAISRQHVAEGYVRNMEPVLHGTQESIGETGKVLETNRKLFKEYEKYSSVLSDFTSQYGDLQQELDLCRSQLAKKDSGYVLRAFSHYKGEEEGHILLPDRVRQLDSSIARLFGEIREIVDLDRELKSTWDSLSESVRTAGGEYDVRKGKLEQIQKNGRNARVKEKAKGLFDTISQHREAFTAQYSDVPAYSAGEEGRYSYQELQTLRGRQRDTASLLEAFRQSLSQLDSYWNELQDQYFTVVTRHYANKSVDQVIEPNPRYREWTETETYQDNETRYRTETYTERVYVGSRIVGDSREDIYENQTKTRQVPYQEWVTKTRQVTKNNGEPREIPVPYDVYEYFFTVEEHRPGGVSKVEVPSGKKHEKFDAAIKSWDYRKEEEIGFVVWKQKWNDEAGLMTGKGIKAFLEE